METSFEPRAIEILLVEDSPADVRLTREALAEGKVTNALHVVGDGEEALQFLRREDPHQDACTPDLVLLDLSLPKKSGDAVLREIKESPELQDIPVVIVTGSIVEEDFHQASAVPCDGYITKPADPEELFRVIKSIEHLSVTITTARPATLAPQPPA
jgi:CheY-like chemotaxis protein